MPSALFGRKKKPDPSVQAGTPAPAQGGLPVTPPASAGTPPAFQPARPATESRPKSNPADWAPVAPPPTPAPPPLRRQNPKDRDLWADPLLSPWAAPAGAETTAAQPAPPSPLDAMGSTTCPRCTTKIVYPRRGSPPWDVVCPQCGARGRMTK